MREHYDYIYSSKDLIELAGRKFHAKRNYINTFIRNYEFSYEEITPERTPECLEMAERWCRAHRCQDDMSLTAEATAVREVLTNFEALHVKGGIIRINGGVEAFSVGELLNSHTAVVHIEKADPEIRGLYAIINQQFCQHAWHDVPFVNREQDLGEAALREAKLSYQPDHLVEKFRVDLAE